ncbi:MAG: hypothetical protein JST30_12170 [Armatimonadetes bacterium]|nr:hypothetical protein [Armatimonadota bacterium]
MNRPDTSLERLVRELRNDLSDNGVEKAVGAFAPTPASPKPRHGPKVWRAVALTACLSVVGIGLLVPKKSSASASFARLVATQKNREVMFQILPYDVDKDAGPSPKIWSGYVMGQRWRYIQSNFEQAFDGTGMTTYNAIGERPFATVQRGQSPGMGNILGSADLGKWKNDPESLSLEHNVTWRGRKVDKYVSRFTWQDAKGEPIVGRSTLYADPVRDLPLYAEHIYPSGNGYAFEWRYVDPPDEELLKIKVPPGVEVKEVEPAVSRPGPPEKAQRAKG